jgi:hypothetical protein
MSGLKPEEHHPIRMEVAVLVQIRQTALGGPSGLGFGGVRGLAALRHPVIWTR